MKETPISLVENKIKNLCREESVITDQKLYDLIDELWELSLSYISETRKLSEVLLDYSLETGYKIGEGFCYRNISYCEMIEGDMNESFKHIRMAEEILVREKEGRGIANVYDIYFHFHNITGNIEKSLEYGLKSLSSSKECGFSRGVAWAYYNLGFYYRDIGDTEKTIEYLNKALEEFVSIEYQTGLLSTLNSIAQYYRENEDLEKALGYLLRARDIAEKIDTPLIASFTYTELAMLYQDIGEGDKACVQHKKAINLVKDLNAGSFSVPIWHNYGKYLLWKEHYEECEVSLIKTLKNAQISQVSSEIYKIHKTLSDLYENSGDLHKSLIHLKEFHETREVVFNSEISSKLRNFEVRLNLEKAEQDAEIQRLKYIELVREKELNEELLHNILPEAVATELREKGAYTPVYYESVSVLFLDIVGFTKIAELLHPKEVLDYLELFFEECDEVTDKYGLEKLKTIGDSYMCVGGIPVECKSHSSDTVCAALELIDRVGIMNKKRNQNGLPQWHIRVGIHTGPVIAGVIGKKKFSYDIWGDTVNIASRFESAGLPGKLNISSATYKNLPNTVISHYRGKLEIKNRGSMDMYFIDGFI